MLWQQLLEQAAQGNQVNLDASWSQGRATFGGLVAALAYQHLRQRVDLTIPVRSVTVSFVAPATVGELTLSAEIFRQGKSVVQAEARVYQQGQVIAVLLASFGVSRNSSIQVPISLMPPSFSAPEQSIVFPYIPQIVPEFTRHFDLRIAEGALPFSGTDHSALGGWVRFKESSTIVGISELLALVDAWPPAVLPMFKIVAPISSLTWTIEFLTDHVSVEMGDWWQYLAETDSAADGYAHIRAHLWSPSGELCAISRQTVAVFA